MKKLAAALGVALVVTGIVAVYLWRELDTQRQQNAATQVRATALESMSETAAPLPAATSTPATSVIPTVAAEAGPSVSTAAPARGSSSLATVAEQLRSTPEGQEFQRVMMRRMLEEKYPDLANAMNLSPEKAGKLLDLLAKRQMDLATDGPGIQSGGRMTRAAREEMNRNLAKREQVFEGELSGLLGDSYPKWQEYSSKANDRQRAKYVGMAEDELRNSISSGGSPLTDTQFQYLNSALTAEQKRIDRESVGMNLQQHLQSLPETNRRLVEVAAAHLNPQQLDGYKRHLQQQEDMLRAIDATGAIR